MVIKKQRFSTVIVNGDKKTKNLCSNINGDPKRKI